MSLRTLFVLLLVVLGLGGAAWWQLGREARGDFTFVEPLFAGVDRARVRAVRVDHLERSMHLKLERDSGHRWWITDPVAYPARDALMRVLLEIIADNPALLVPEEELAAVRESFDPPRAVFEVTEGLEDGSERKSRIELGPLDIDGVRVYVRARGRIWRTLRNLDTVLKHNVNEFRSLRMFDLSTREVVSVRRSGHEMTADGPRSVFLEAERRGVAWRLNHPYRAQADPTTVFTFIAGVTRLTVKRFVADAPPDLSKYFLDEPQIRIELSDRLGNTQKLLLSGHLDDGRWFAKREDLPFVWQVDETEIFRTVQPAETMLDQQLVRTLRDDIESVHLLSERGRLVLARVAGERERWTVAREGEDGTMARPADPARVEHVISSLERATIARFLFEEDTEVHFGPDLPTRGVWIVAGGERQGGRLGGRFQSDGGAEAVFFRREGESVAGLVPVELEELALLELGSLVSLQLLELDEVELRELRLVVDGTERAFTRKIEGTWRYADLELDATELYPVLDSLFFLRGSEHVESGSTGALEQVVSVEMRDYKGEWHTARIGRAAGGRSEAEVLGRRSVLEDQELHGRLLALVQGD